MDFIKKNFISMLIAIGLILINTTASIYLVFGKEDLDEIKTSLDSCDIKDYVDKKIDTLENRINKNNK